MDQTNQLIQLDNVISNLKIQLDILIKTRNELSGECKTIETIANTFHCSKCNINFDSKDKLERHLISKTHLKNTGQTGNVKNVTELFMVRNNLNYINKMVLVKDLEHVTVLYFLICKVNLFI